VDTDKPEFDWPELPAELAQRIADHGLREAKIETPEPVLLAPLVGAELSSVLSGAQTGDPKVLARLRELLDSRPEIWGSFGDLAGHAERP
jgi:hypothetical protein